MLDIKDKTVLETISPIIGIHFNPLVMLLTGTFGGFVSGFLSTGCGIIITPLLISLGLPPFVAVSTQLCHAVGTNFISFLVYKRKTDVDFTLAFCILVGGSIGAFCEWIFLKHATNPQTIMQKFLYVYIAVLSIFGFVTLRRSFITRKRLKNTVTNYNLVMRKWMKYLPIHKVFVRSRSEMSVFIPILLGVLTGMLVASLGGGSNLFMAPILTYLIGRISPVVYGTVSMASFVITVFVTFAYSFQHYCCDIVIVLLLFAGASFGSWCGVKLTYKVSRYYIGIISGSLMLCLAGKQVCKIINNPRCFEAQQQNFMPTSIDVHPVMYTFTCIILIMIIAYFHERFLEKVSKTRWFRK